MASDKIKIALEQDTNARPIEISVMQDDCPVISATVLTGYASDVPGQILERIEAIEALIPTEATPENQLADKEYVSDAVSAVETTVTAVTGRVENLETCCEELKQTTATNAGAIASNTSKIQAETERATGAEAELQDAITAEQSRAESAESTLDNKIDSVESHLEAFEQEVTADKTELQNAIQAETARATKAEGDLQTAITAETQRATEAESALDADIKAETARATKAESNLQTAISEETTRATGVENTLTSAISAETIRAEGVESDLDDKITAEQTRATGAENALSERVATIEEKIPTQASANNQLADKAFVNSSVQTASAHFRGNWPTYADVPSIATAYPVDGTGSTTPTMNDYLVVEKDENENDETWRYKYIGDWATNGKSGWRAEYKVNNTALTAAQLAAINSNITADGVAQITTNQNNIASLTQQVASNTAALETVQGKLTPEQLAAVNSGATSANIAQIATNKSDISTLSTMKADKTEIADMLTATDAAGIYETQATATSAHNSLSGEISTLAGTVALKANTADVAANYATKSALSETSAQVATNTQDITEAMADIAALGTDKQDKLVAGDNITIEGNTISATGGKLPDNVLVNNAAQPSTSLAIGEGAEAIGRDSIQLGKGTNTDEGTVAFFKDGIYDFSAHLFFANRLAKGGEPGQALVKGSDGLFAEWQDVSGGGVVLEIITED